MELRLSAAGLTSWKESVRGPGERRVDEPQDNRNFAVRRIWCQRNYMAQGLKKET